MHHLTIRTLLCALLGAALLSCNMFEPASADRDEYARRQGPEALIMEGKVQMRDQKWEEALALFQEAIRKDSTKSEAWYYAGKCMLRIQGIDLNDVWNEINPAPGTRDADAVPFLYKEDTASGRLLGDSLATAFVLVGDTAYTIVDSVFLVRKQAYDVISTSVKYLEYIYQHPATMDGAIVRKQYESDYLVEIGVRTVLSIIDVNGNDSLDYGTASAPSDERTAFRILCKDIESLDDMSIDSLKAISTNPMLINGKIDDLLATVLKADTSYGNFRFEIDSADMDTSMAAGLGDMIGQFKTIIPFYYYDDCMDNDGNYFNTDSVWAPGTANAATVLDTNIDRMIWIDWDQDEFIDVNPPGTSPHVHIGEAAHRAANPQYYIAVDAPGADFARYRYTGPYTYEFIFGDWGVDEEIMEGDDNTFDSLADEDSRVIDDTLDNDGDWLRIVSDPPDRPVKTDWSDADNDFRYDGVLPTVLRAKPDTLPYFAIAVYVRSQNPLDTLDLGSRTILTFAGTNHTGEFTGGDYGIDEEYYDGLDNDGDSLIDEDVGKTSMIPPESQRAALISQLTNAAYHLHLHGYWTKIQDYWISIRGRNQ